MKEVLKALKPTKYSLLFGLGYAMFLGGMVFGFLFFDILYQNGNIVCGIIVIIAGTVITMLGMIVTMFAHSQMSE